jgi:type IV pilus assembly protein PilM
MDLFPKASGTRPRVACEISPQGVVAARSAAAEGPIEAVARVLLAQGAVLPGLKPGNVVDRVAVAAAIRRAMEQVGERAAGRGGEAISLIIPDAAVRVLLLEFESLPTKLTEALPLVRFRLKKLVPFEPDEAMVSYQVMSTSRNLVRVLAVAIPRDVLSEYETAVREAGFEPGAVLPSTLASLAVLEGEEPSLVVNANPLGVTTAIVRSGILLLHRCVDLQDHTATTATPIAAAAPVVVLPVALPIVSTEETAAEWAAQEPLPEHGRNPYADQITAEAAVQSFDAVGGDEGPVRNAGAAQDLQPVPLAAEIAQAVSVAAAYFEDTLAQVPTEVLSAGPLGADRLSRILVEQGIAEADGVRVRELVTAAALAAEASTATAPRAWLSGVAGALRG